MCLNFTDSICFVTASVMVKRVPLLLGERSCKWVFVLDAERAVKDWLSVVFY